MSKIKKVIILLSTSIVSMYAVDVSTPSELENAIISANAGGDSTINIIQDFSYAQTFRPINTNPDFTSANKTITIQNNTSGTPRVLTSDLLNPCFFIFGGTGSVTLKDLTLMNANSKGGNGGLGAGATESPYLVPGGGGGGGLGAGGGIFVNENAYVIIDNLSFINCSAAGGNGGELLAEASNSSGGGGGFHGDGGDVTPYREPGGGGGGGFLGKGGDSASGFNAFASGGGGGALGNGENGVASASILAAGGGDFDGNNGGVPNNGNGGNGGGGAAQGGRGGYGGGAGGGQDGIAFNGGEFGGGGGLPLPGLGLGTNGGFGGGGGGSVTPAEASAVKARLPYGPGGSGGFGGGAGGGAIPGHSVFGGGTNATGLVGNGGAGLGGAIFIKTGGTLIVRNTVNFTGNSTTSGTGGTNVLSLGNDIFLMSGGRLIFDLSSDLTISSSIESDQNAGGGTGGGLEKQGDSRLTLSGTNTYTGGTKVTMGVLKGTATSLQGEIINNASVIFDQATSGTYSGAMSGSGLLTKIGGGRLILSGSNTYSGGTRVSMGTLEGTTNSLQGEITNNASVIFDQASSGTYSGAMSGSGSLTKTGLGKVTLSGANTFLGITSIEQGSLDVRGSLNSPVTISPSAVLQGTGSVGTVQNNGTVTPGASIGTLTINGDYTQDASASLIIEIDDDPAISDVLLITGSANLDGSLGLNPLPGLYEGGTVYTFLQAGVVNGTFSQLIETGSLDFVINYFSNSVQIFIPSPRAILPKPINELKGNSKKIGDYLFSCLVRSSNDLTPILKSLLKVSPKDFSAALSQLGPQQFGSLALSNLQTSARVGQSMNRTRNAYENYYLTPCYQSSKDPASSPDQSMWFNPIGYYYKQNEVQEQVPFNSKTYGFTIGFNTRLFNHLVLSAGTGYTHSILDWYENKGKAHIQSAYLSPSIGYVGEYGYVGLVLLGSRSFYEVNRKIHLSSFKDKAYSDHKSYDLLAGCRGGLKIKFPENFQKSLFLLPTVNLDYLNIFEGGYRESGAGAINLSVKNVRSAFLRPEVKLKLLKELNMHSVCSFPSIYVGWLRNILLTNSTYTSRFYKQKACAKNFTVQSYHSSTNQLVFGAEILVAYKDNCSLKLGYEANIGNHYTAQEGNLNFNKAF